MIQPPLYKAKQQLKVHRHSLKATAYTIYCPPIFFEVKDYKAVRAPVTESMI